MIIAVQTTFLQRAVGVRFPFALAQPSAVRSGRRFRLEGGLVGACKRWSTRCTCALVTRLSQDERNGSTYVGTVWHYRRTSATFRARPDISGIADLRTVNPSRKLHRFESCTCHHSFCRSMCIFGTVEDARILPSGRCGHAGRPRAVSFRFARHVTRALPVASPRHGRRATGSSVRRRPE